MTIMTNSPSVYIAIALRTRSHYDNIIRVICAVVEKAGMNPIVFVDQFDYAPQEARAMMQMAFQTLENADLLIVEGSEKAIGVGVEVGYAAGKNKPIIYLRHENAEYSTTVGGTATYALVYQDAEDLHQQLIRTLRELGYQSGA